MKLGSYNYNTREATDIHGVALGTFAFEPKSAGRGRGCPSSGLIELRSRVIAALHVDHFAALKPDLMLSPACLCCGKGLTDPVSIARWIGPECWGSASTNIPRIFKAEDLRTFNPRGTAMSSNFVTRRQAAP
ncbi:MAG: hypothetical protein AUI16_01045 [Alphaproteobacteria bacterium 13_2_20CM_2_64_7]|jgi:hypothetical protein|nr:MAG: hypothetical protein AUI16_01045 [Alphaproteobacteria bacterium 13_2_20CM_2_64_7]